jgi:hypothetical protein
MADWILEPRFVRVTASAESTREDLLDAIAASAADPRFVRTSGLLLDMRARPPQADVDPREMRESVRVVTSLGFGRCAIVAVAPARLQRGQVFAKYAEVRDLPTEVFFEIGAAERWLEAASSAEPATGSHPPR